jgi:phosphotransferase system HPr (HPr) family protein
VNPARDIELVISNRTGLHARPAREFVNVARRFQSEVRVHHGAKRANGKSLAGLLTLGVRSGGAIRIEVEGDDGEAALQALTAAVTGGLGEAGDAAPAGTTDATGGDESAPRDATRGGVNRPALPGERGRESPLWINDLRRRGME